jgi:type IV secretory pathway ATPase VirB11/archaellum biosynthesis ATPase
MTTDLMGSILLSSSDEKLDGELFLVTIHQGTPTWKTLNRSFSMLGLYPKNFDLPDHLVFTSGDTFADGYDPPASVLIGVGEGDADMILDLSKNPGVIIAGASGSGKTTIMGTIQEHGLSVDKIRVDTIDLKHDLEPKSSRSWDRTATTMNDACSLVTRLAVEMDDRIEALKNSGGDRSVMDEIRSSWRTDWVLVNAGGFLLSDHGTLTDLHDSGDHDVEKAVLMRDAINKIMQRGADVGIYVFISTGDVHPVNGEGPRIFTFGIMVSSVTD